MNTPNRINELVRFKLLLYCICVLKRNTINELSQELNSIQILLYNELDHNISFEQLKQDILAEIEIGLKTLELVDNIIFYPSEFSMLLPESTKNIKFEFIPSTFRKLANKIIIQDKEEILLFN